MRNVLIFDIGGVIVDYDNDSFCEWIKNKFETKGNIGQVYKKLEGMIDIDQIDEHELHRRFTEEINVKISEEDFYKQYYQNHVRPHFEVLGFIKDNLYGRYELDVFSNNCKISVRKLKEATDFEKLFNKCVYSFDLGVKKPDIEFFKQGLERIAHKGEECIFFDDRLDFKEPSEKLGIQFVHYTGLDKLKQDLTYFGIDY